MNSLIWLWLYSLLSTACNVDHAMWWPDYGMTVLSDLIPALPQVTVEKFKTLNGGINPNKIGEGVEYKVPYSSEMKINKPAKWSGNCPKTLLLLGEEEPQKTPTPTQHETPSSLTQRTTHTPVAGSGTTTDYAATTTTSTQKADSPTNSKPTGQATDTTRNMTPTAVKGGFKKATGSAGSGSAETAAASGGERSSAAKQFTCWTSDNPYYLNTSKAIKEKAVNDFCKKFKESPLTPKGDNTFIQNNLHLDAHLDKRCEFKVDEAVCVEYFKDIEKECSGGGGVLVQDCAQVWIETDLQ